MSEALAVVVPVHSKDLPKLGLCLAGIRAHLQQAGTIHVVGASELDEPIREIAAQAKIEDLRFIAERDHFHAEGGWLLQQEIKLEFRRVVDLTRYVVVDADTIFLAPTPSVDSEGRLLASRDLARARYGDHLKGCHCRRYLPTLHHLFGLPHELHASCHIAHHAVFEVELLAQMLEPVRSEGLDRAFVRAYRSGASFSEYDSYGAYARHHAPGRYRDRNDLWADVPWPRVASEAQQRAYLERYAAAGFAFVSAHGYLDDYLDPEGCLAFADWLVDRTEDPDYRAGRWGLQQWAKRGREAGADLVRELERALDGRIRGLSSYCFVAPDGVGHLRSESLYSEAQLATVAADVHGMRVFVEAWSRADARPELDELAEALRSSEDALASSSLVSRLPSLTRRTIETWQALREQPGGRRLGAPLDSLAAEALTTIVELLGPRRSDREQLLELFTNLPQRFSRGV